MITHQSNAFLFEKEVSWDFAGEKCQRQVMGYNDDVMLVKVKFEKGGIGTPHTHPHTQTTFVAEGVFDFTIGNETRRVKAGDALYMAPGIEHGCTCLEAGLLIDCFAPMRETFLSK